MNEKEQQNPILEIDFLDIPTSDDIAEIIKNEDLSEKEEDIISENYNLEEKKINSVFWKLHEKGYIEELPKNFSADDERELSLEELEDVLNHNLPILLENQTKSTTDYLKSKMSPQLQKLFEYELNGGKFKKNFADDLAYEKDFKELNEEDEYQAELIITECLKSDNYSDEEISEEINDYKSTGLLVKKAKSLKSKYLNKLEQKNNKYLEDQKTIADNNIEFQKQIKTKISDYLDTKENIFNIPINNTIKDIAKNILLKNTQVTLPNEEKVTKPITEALIDFHKYHEKGNLESLIMASLFLYNSDLALDLLKNQLKQNTQEEFIKQNKYSFLK